MPCWLPQTLLMHALRYRQALSIDPNHVDTLCNYALLLRDAFGNHNKVV